MMKQCLARFAAGAVIGLALTAPVFAADTVTIGSFVATSGSGAPFGLDQLQGMKVAVEQINAAGGIAGHKIELKHQSTDYDKTQAQSVVNQFVADKSIIGLIGPTSSAEAFAADPIAVAAKLPVLAPANGAAGVPQIGPYVHRIGVPEELLLPSAVNAASDALKFKNVAILYAQNDPFATTGFKAFQTQLEAKHVNIVEVIGYDSSTVDFAAQLQRVKDKKPDALFVAAKSSDAALLLRQARQSGIDVPVVGNLAFTSPSLVAAAGDAINGLIVAAVWDPSDSSTVNQKFVSAYKDEFKRDPTPLSATAYNCIYLIKEALEKSKDFSRAGLQVGLNEIKTFKHLGSEIIFKDIGNGLRDATVAEPVMFQYKDRKLTKMSM
jgi:branched-chain amino acid transport system substrate-binding protein